MAEFYEEAVTIHTPADFDKVEAVIRFLSSAEKGGACSGLSSTSYRTFRVQCLRDLALVETKQNHLPVNIRAFLNMNIVVSYNNKIVRVMQRGIQYELPQVAPMPSAHQPQPRKRKHDEEGRTKSWAGFAATFEKMRPPPVLRSNNIYFGRQ